MKTELWPHQVRTIADVRASFRSGARHIVVQSPTGSGKTKVAADLIHSALEKGNRATFTVPYLELIDQTCRSFMDEGLRPCADFGVIQGDHPWMFPGAPLQICSLDTLGRRNYMIKQGVVFVDEAHLMNKHLFKWMAECPEQTFLGLTATPWARGMGKHWQDLVIGSTTRELIDAGYLSDFRVFAPSAPDLSNVGTVAGDYNQKHLGAAVNNVELVASIVDTWVEKAHGAQTILFAVDRLHAQTLQKQFQQRGVAAGYIDAYTTRDDRETLRKQFESGDISVVCNVGVLIAGVDWDVRCIVLARPTKSEIRFVQMIGRGLRTAEGKEYCLILDHSDTHNRLGFVTDIHHSSLDMGTERANSNSEKKEYLPKPCKSCGILLEKGVKICPACGKVRQLPKSEIEEQDGELVELTSKAWKRTKKTYSAEEKQKIWAQLKWIANERGRSAGWIWHTMQDMCGSAPRNQNVLPEPPTTEVKNYVLYKDIKFKMSKKKAGAR